MRPICAAFAMLTLGLVSTVPAHAQEAAEPKVNMVDVFGKDKCPESSDDTIVICKRYDEGERFRIPESLRTSASPQNEAWNQKVRAYEMVGRSGTMSCSPVGAGGFTGCTGQLINQAYAEKKTAPGVRASQLIAEERAKRLSTIDQDAAETQSAVEMQEEQILARRRLEQQASGEPAPSSEAEPRPEAEKPQPK